MGDDQVRTECLGSLSAQEVALHGCSIQRSVQQIEHNLNLSKKTLAPITDVRQRQYFILTSIIFVIRELQVKQSL